MKDRNDHLKKIYLLPGHFFWGDEKYEISTTLGSCVAICMWHPLKKIGGMSHYRFPGGRNARRWSLNLHYGDDVIFKFMDLIRKNNTRPGEYIVKIFGGASMFEKKYSDTIKPIGESNSEFAITKLIEYGFTIRIREVGGTDSRKIFFNLSNGDIWMQKLKKQAPIN